MNDAEIFTQVRASSVRRCVGEEYIPGLTGVFADLEVQFAHGVSLERVCERIAKARDELDRVRKELLNTKLMSSSIFPRVRQIIARELRRLEDRVVATARLYEDLFMHEGTQWRLARALEREFGIEIDESKLRSLTVSGLLTFLEDAIANKTGEPT